MDQRVTFELSPLEMVNQSLYGEGKGNGGSTPLDDPGGNMKSTVGFPTYFKVSYQICK